MSDEIKLCNEVVELKVPKSIVERFEVVTALQAGVGVFRGHAVVVALCWPRLRRWLEKDDIHWSGNVSVYGKQVFDWLSSQKHPLDVGQFHQVAREARRLCEEALPGRELPQSEEALEEAVGNSERPAEDSRS